MEIFTKINRGKKANCSSLIYQICVTLHRYDFVKFRNTDSDQYNPIDRSCQPITSIICHFNRNTENVCEAKTEITIPRKLPDKQRAIKAESQKCDLNIKKFWSSLDWIAIGIRRYWLPAVNYILDKQQKTLKINKNRYDSRRMRQWDVGKRGYAHFSASHRYAFMYLDQFARRGEIADFRIVRFRRPF